MIGVNKYRLEENEKIEVLKIENAEVRAAQIAIPSTAWPSARSMHLQMPAAGLTGHCCA